MQNERIRVITEVQYKEYMELKNRFGDTNKKVRRWKPKDGYNYYGITGDGIIKSIVWNTDDVDYGYYKLGNCFKTEEEAQKELDRRLAEQELLDMCDCDGRVELCYDEHAECFEADDTSEFPYYHSPYRFASEESCKLAIDLLGTEKLKLVFRID